jgi:hypothetical protein
VLVRRSVAPDIRDGVAYLTGVRRHGFLNDCRLLQL